MIGWVKLMGKTQTCINLQSASFLELIIQMCMFESHEFDTMKFIWWLKPPKTALVISQQILLKIIISCN